MPRRSAEALLAVRSPTHAQRPLVPPAGLSAPERELFRRLVAAVAPGHFAACDVPVLVEFCAASLLARQAAERLAAEGAVVDGRQNAWMTVWGNATKTLAALSTRLRLAPSARLDHAQAGKTAHGRGPAGVGVLFRDHADD